MFYCGMHPLDTFAKSADTAAKHWEQEVHGQETCQGFKSCGNSNTLAIIKALCRLCFKDGTGLPAEIETHLTMNGIKKNPLVPIMGNRFHVYFFNAGAAFFIIPCILNFLTIKGVV